MATRNIRTASEWAVLEKKVRLVYGQGPNSDQLLSDIHDRLKSAIGARKPELLALDQTRSQAPEWTQACGESVYTFYVDRFAGDLLGTTNRLDYLQELGVRWLHPLPLLKARTGDSDGGFAVADYRAVEPSLGTMADLSQLTDALRDRNMGLLVDVVCNHTAREHDWAVKARSGDIAYKDYYRVLDTAAEVEEWEAHLTDVFPDTAPGSFTYDEAMGGWVWTTFYPFQWDLNYANPAVFLEMLEVLLFLSNQGVEGFRLDSAPFLWKREGTNCRNQPEAYAIVEAWRAALSLAAPGVVLLAEAIESLDDVLPFFGSDVPGCHLAYNNGVMTALWGALAQGDAGIARKVMLAAAHRPDHAAWLNYVRCHDDLIWNALSTYTSKENLEAWSRFFDGQGFSGGRAFQTAAGGVPSTNGMAASLVGLGRPDVDPSMALERLKLMYGLIHALDGWPLIYMGDEIALGNDETYSNDPQRMGDGRWLHRPQMDWQAAEHRRVPGTPQAAAFGALAHFIEVAKGLNTLGVSGRALPLQSGPSEVLGFDRLDGKTHLRVLANMSPRPVSLDLEAFTGAEDALSGTCQGHEITLPAYGLVWLTRKA